ncbi:MAG: Holliday junction branch migration protein RuvA [Lachnospiraceae bacterium]|nr:Holliday junction branch migration protein RuvA [Lachnospiraceae bacterium]
MFAFVEGLLDDLNMDSCVVDVGGFGVNVGITSRTAIALPGIGEHVKLYTYTSVREDGISLYGFDSRDDLGMFKKLISVSGVGPKVALALLSSMESETLKLAIISEDAKSISKAQGVGAKIAQRIVLELKDKVKMSDEAIISELKSGGASDKVKSLNLQMSSEMEDAVSALTALGYGITEARNTVASLPGAESMESGEILSAALKVLY